MASRRMFNIEILESDNFLSLSDSAKLLYIYLCLACDDDGITSKKRKTEALIETTEEAYKELLTSGFIYEIEGVTVVKHWNLHNKIQKDRYHETIYKNVKSKLILDTDKVYGYNVYTNMDTTCIQNVNSDKVRLGKSSLDKSSIEKISEDKSMREETFISYQTFSKACNNIDINKALHEDDKRTIYDFVIKNHEVNYIPTVLEYIKTKEGK